MSTGYTDICDGNDVALNLFNAMIIDMVLVHAHKLLRKNSAQLY